MRDQFPHKKAGDRLSAPHVNRLSEAARRAGTPAAGSYSLLSSYGTIQGHANYAPFYQGVFEVVADLKEMSPSYDGIFRIKERLYSKNDENPKQAWKASPLNNHVYMDAYALGARYTVGDLVVAYWSEHRGMFLPAMGHLSWNIAKAPTGGIPAISGNTPGTAVCDIYHIVEGVLEAVTDDQDEQVTRTLYNMSGVAVTANAWVQYKVNIDGHHLVDFEGCTA